jgi:hypothetical protein
VGTPVRRKWGLRKRDAQFADFFLKELETKDVREAMIAAGRKLGWCWNGTSAKTGQMWSQPMKDIQVLRKAKAILKRETVVEYMAYLFEAVGFSPLDATRKLVAHIDGIEYERVTLDKETGEPVAVTLKEKPSLDALKHYHKLTTTEQVKKVEVDQRTLVAHKMISEEPPRMRARILKAAVDDAVSTP